MEKGFGISYTGICQSPFFMKGGDENENKKTIIAFRKTCKSNGTGLSHYILLTNKKEKK
jgi:modified peptide precursor CbpA